MNRDISASLITLKSQGGDELKELFISLADELGLKLNLLENPTQTDFFKACKNDDVVVFDASIENSKNNYHAATAQPMSIDDITPSHCRYCFLPSLYLFLLRYRI